MLESFQAVIGKRILGISKYHSNTSTLIGLHWPSVKARILLLKLTFLAKVLERDDVLSPHVLRTLASEDVYNVSIVQQCCSLEQHTICNFVSAIPLMPPRSYVMKEKKSGEKIGCILYSNPKHTGLFQLSPPRKLLRQARTAYGTKNWISVSRALHCHYMYTPWKTNTYMYIKKGCC